MVYYFAQNATIEAYSPFTKQYEVVGAVQECSFEWNVEDVKLYQFGTIKRADASRHSASVNVTVKLAKFGSPTQGNDWFWAILNGVGWEGTGQARQVTVSDTTNFPMFKIAGQFRPTDGDVNSYIYVEVIEIYFKTFQWGGSLGEYIMEDLQGEGSDITYSVAPPTGWIPKSFQLAINEEVPVVIRVGEEKDVNLNYIRDECKYNVGTANDSVATAEVSCEGKITISAKSEGDTLIFAAADTYTMSIPVRVVGE